MSKTKKELKVTAIDFAKIIETANKGIDLAPVSLKRSSSVQDSVPSGSLVFDLITGGGFPPGRWTTLYGGEGSGKSLTTCQAIKHALDLGIPTFAFDHEGSYDPSFMSRMGIDFNKLTLDTSNFFYYQPETGEMTYRYIHRILDQLPDKSEGPVSAIFIIDSLPAMLPEARDENDNSSPMGAVARMHSLNMPLIVTKIASKRVCILATNQMRNKIGAYGDPSIESCGEAPKYFSHVRVKMSLRSFKEEGPIHEEPAWDGVGIDRYKLCEIRTVKNKVFSPFRQSTMRLWFEEKGAPGRGIDPVYDCYQYLVETGQAVMSRGRIALIVPGWTNRTYLWKEFKELILVPEDRLAVVAERYKVDENSSLRLYCRSQLNDGSAFTKYFDAVGQVNSIGELPDEESEKASK